MLEADFEKIIRRQLKRGTLSVQVRIERATGDGQPKLNTSLLKRYIDQLLVELKGLSPADRTAVLSGVLTLPGVAPESFESTADAKEEWPAVEAVLEAALVDLNAARAVEGRAMRAELRNLAAVITAELGRIAQHLPQVVAAYRERLAERVKTAIADVGVPLEPAHLVREIAIFADRIDVAEEMIRLTSHLSAFDEILGGASDSPGRRLEFVVQEMGREANTLGSKAGDVTISRHVVEIKATLEKIRELVQNVE